MASAVGQGTGSIQLPLTRKEIYQQIDRRICQVITEVGKATGICLHERSIAVPCHVLRLEQAEGGYRSGLLRCVYQGVEYTAQPIRSVDKAFALDCSIYQVEDEEFPRFPPIALFEGSPDLGEEVYFGGFPLTQMEATIHHGFISSVSSEEFLSFTIDGSVVPGHSGAPVFVVADQVMKLVGVIFHQIADFPPQDRETIEIMEWFANQPNPPGMTRTVTLNRPTGPVKRNITDVEVTALAFDLIRRNLSTGIGTAFHASYLRSLANGEDFLVPPLALRMMGMAVKRKDQIVQTYSTNGKTYYTHCDGHESKHLRLSRKLKRKALIDSTSTGPAMFFGDAAQNYNTLLRNAIVAWANAGAPNPSYHTFDFEVGADEGKATNSVEIYYQEKIGSHMRPKTL